MLLTTYLSKILCAKKYEHDLIYFTLFDNVAVSESSAVASCIAASYFSN